MVVGMIYFRDMHGENNPALRACIASSKIFHAVRAGLFSLKIHSKHTKKSFSHSMKNLAGSNTCNTKNGKICDIQILWVHFLGICPSFSNLCKLFWLLRSPRKNNR
jgi:hypothetical protein